ncbi:MAG: hypothetical protein ABFC67_10290 [Mizugakiibacter sp.]|uniref:hypothetical protein n=1 Tax=Mizugakiibacter sp. TaxID=1972610 RepID=UPI0031C83C40|nr:hypothetical protein [Xanthomonadaceae bacterium]
MPKSRILLLLLVPLLALTMAFRQAPLVNPDPIHVPAGLTDAQVAKAISSALIGRGWSVTAEKAGETDASLHLREHVARIAITYDASAVQVKYVDSENLKYEMKDGKPYIHKNYLGWIEYLVQDINRSLQLLTH